MTLFKNLVLSSVLIEDKNVTQFDLHKKYFGNRIFSSLQLENEAGTGSSRFIHETNLKKLNANGPEAQVVFFGLFL